jgi:hypothetical protein
MLPIKQGFIEDEEKSQQKSGKLHIKKSLVILYFLE